MRILAGLGWWIFLVGALEAAAAILDRFHHMGLGLAGVLLLKGGYLAFALLLVLRYRSFRSQRIFENLAEAYRRTVGRESVPPAPPKTSPRHPFFYLALICLAAADCLAMLHWSLFGLRLSILFDFSIWVLILRWVGRAHWLKARGARERLKEALDDARSLSRTAGPEPQPAARTVGKAPFAALTGGAMAFSLAVAGFRWTESAQAFRIDDVQGCMDRCMRAAVADFYRRGELGLRPAEEECVRERADALEFALDFRAGELRLWVREIPGSDFFGDGRPGNQEISLDANGHFRRGFSPAP